MRGAGTRVGRGALAAVAGALALAACNAPARTQEETRMFPKAPLQEMGPIIRQEPTTAMSRLARFNKPRVVEIPVEAVTPRK